MNLLIDTHILLWFINGDDRLSTETREKISNAENSCYVSIASIWEIAIKLSLDKLEIDGGVETVQNFFENNDFEILPVDFPDIKTLLRLKYHHRDPFDRMIIAQAIASGLTIVTVDGVFSKYETKILK